MKRQKLLVCFIVIIIISSIPIVALAAGKHALLIGIQDYGYHPLFPSLKGPANDLKIMEKVLRERFEFQDGDFLILMDAQATHSRIEQTFKTLIDVVQSGDFVYIYYSGHGSQTKDLNGDERSGQDQTWVSYGARKDETEQRDNYDILDDEIDAWLAALYEKTNNVVFISDSCHSATVSRGQAAISRAIESDTRSHPLGRKLYLQPKKNYGVRVAAARDGESAIEILIDLPTEKKEEYFGLFTWHWVQALQQAREGDTWNDVFKRTYPHVTAIRGNVQRPQLWGERSLQVVGGDFTPMKPTIPVTDIDDDLVTIQAGYLSGVTVGSVYRLHGPDNPNPPTLTITKIKTFESIGKAEGTFERGDLVIEESHAYGFSALKVYVDADYPDDYDKLLLQAIRSAFQACPDETPVLPAYTLTDNPQQADLHLYILRPKRKNGQYIREPNDVLAKSFPGQPPEVWILTPEHRLLHENLRIHFDDQDPTRGIRILRENLNKYARIRELKALGASWGSRLQITAEAYLLTPVDSCQEGPDCKFLSDDLGFYQVTGPFSLQEIEKRTFAKGDILTFTLHNTSDRDYYYYLINIAPDGTVEAIFPHPEEEPDYALVKAGESRELINDVGLMTELPGEETVKFIVSHQPFDVSLLEMEGFEKRGGTRGEYNPLEQLLVNALYGHRGRVSLRNDEWATKQLSFEVGIEH